MKREFARGCVLAALMLALVLGGCDSWRRTPSPDAPKEVPVSAPAQNTGEAPSSPEDTEEIEESLQSEESGEDTPEEDGFLAQSASITSRTNESVRWNTEDEMLSQKLYDLLTNKNEDFTEKFDEREYDYLSVITDSEGNEKKFYLWINFQRQNEIIVEDIEGTQWNISVEDSNQVRAMAKVLVTG